MAVSFKYWDECVEAEDMEAMWNDSEVSIEWINAGETRGQKVHLSRDPDGQAYLTQTEMKAVAGIIVNRHFYSQVDPETICAIAELESDRQLLAMRYEKKTKQTTVGIMQILPKTADWLAKECGFRAYEVEGNPELLYRPFISVYVGAAYIKWLSNFEQKERNEEFVIRAYKNGTKKATHKSTLPYWKRYLSVKDSLPSRKYLKDLPFLSHDPSLPDPSLPDPPSVSDAPAATVPDSQTAGDAYTYWDSRVSPEDMEDMWNHPVILREWTKSGEKRGKVRFSHDAKKRPYLSQVEVKAVAEIILFRHFSAKGVKPEVLCAIAEIVSMRFSNGVGSRIGIMGIDFPTASWLYKISVIWSERTLTSHDNTGTSTILKDLCNIECRDVLELFDVMIRELGCKAYKVKCVEDLKQPFVSMYFGAAYMAWLSEYEGRVQTPEFVVQAYIAGPKNVNLPESGHVWLKFKDALGSYGDSKRDQGSCSIL